MTLRSAQGKPVGEALREGRRILTNAGIEEADLEAELLLRHALGIDRADLFAHLDGGIDPDRRAAYQAFLARRLAHEPTAYITGRREFYGLDFQVTPAALIPRPETELLVDEALRIWASMLEARSSKPEEAIPRLADVGTGSGAVAVALAVHLPEATIVATDTSRDALLLAGRNARRHGVGDRIALVQTDLLAGLRPDADARSGRPSGRPPFDLVVANLPYVPTAVWEALPPEIRDHEPRAALDGGADGLSAIHRLLRAAPAYLTPGGALLLEIGADQGPAVLALARQALPGRTARILKDATGRDRVLAVRR